MDLVWIAPPSRNLHPSPCEHRSSTESPHMKNQHASYNAIKFLSYFNYIWQRMMFCIILLQVSALSCMIMDHIWYQKPPDMWGTQDNRKNIELLHEIYISPHMVTCHFSRKCMIIACCFLIKLYIAFILFWSNTCMISPHSVGLIRDEKIQWGLTQLCSQNTKWIHQLILAVWAHSPWLNSKFIQISYA